MTSVQSEKRALREECRRKRAASAAGAGSRAAGLAEQFCHSVPVRDGAVVAGYMPIRDEIDVRPLLRRLRGGGHAIALPRIVRSGLPLRFAAWDLDDDLVAGPLGTVQPGPGAAEAMPDLVIVPLLAFDRAGYRLGYGGGYYDRTLSEMRRHRALTAVGVGFAEQEVAAVPHDRQDQRLDWVVTDREAIDFGIGET